MPKISQKILVILIGFIILFFFSFQNNNSIPAVFAANQENTLISSQLAGVLKSLQNVLSQLKTALNQSVNQSVSQSEFQDGKNLIVFAHQDDDLLWMLPFWQYANKFIIAAYPAPPVYAIIVAKISQQIPQYADYSSKWHPSFGTTTMENFRDFWLDKCARAGDLTLPVIKENLRPYISDANIKRIITHNNWGEYGHIHHRLVNQAVRELALEYNKDVWALSMKTAVNGGNYENTGTFGFSYINLSFDDSVFQKIKAIYQTETLISDTQGNPIADAWTWHDSTNEYPFGQRTFVKIVDKIKKKDLTIANAAIKQIVDSVPVTGLCEPDITRVEKEFIADPPNNDANALFCPVGYKRVTCQSWRETPLELGMKLEYKIAFTDDYPTLYSSGGCAMSYCGQDNNYKCKARISCIK
jgi:LmbE family N-acetylglucosaminyl deacetylase